MTKYYQSKNILWFVMRARSTAFTRAIAQIPEMRVLFEPYYSAAAYGPDRIFRGFCDVVPEETNCSYLSVRSLLERPEDQNPVFVKDCSSGMPADKFEHLPKNYRHAFLIRDPLEIVQSIHSVVTRSVAKNYAFSQNSLVELIGYPQMLKLFNRLVNSSQNPLLVIESSELSKQPEAVIQRYCRHANLPFSKALLRWNSLDHFPKAWWKSNSDQMLNKATATYENALSSGSFFHKPSFALREEADLPADYRHAADKMYPHYEILLAHSRKHLLEEAV